MYVNKTDQPDLRLIHYFIVNFEKNRKKVCLRLSETFTKQITLVTNLCCEFKLNELFK